MSENEAKIEELMERFKFCNCGKPEAALRAMQRCLESIVDVPYPMMDEEWLVVYLLETEGYIDHEGNICASWLTDRGEALLEELKGLDLS